MSTMRFVEHLKVVVALTILVVAVIVALSPGLTYAGPPKVVLYLLVSLLPAVLFGAEATTRFELKLPGFVFTTVGAVAFVLGTLLLLTHISKPELQIAVFRVLDEKGAPLALDWGAEAFETYTSSYGYKVTSYVDGTSVILVFPEQIAEVNVCVKKSPRGPCFSGVVRYAGNRKSTLRLGQDLTTSNGG